MVMLYMCGACQQERHEECERGHSVPRGQFGGSICTCHCNGRSQKQMDAEHAAEFKERWGYDLPVISKADIEELSVEDWAKQMRDAKANAQQQQSSTEGSK